MKPISYKRLKENPRLIFLIDLAGALITMMILLFVVGNRPHWFGIPISAIRIMLFMALCISIYDLRCYTSQYTHFKHHVAFLALLNIVYIILTAILLLVHAGSLTGLGVTYIIGEMIVIAVLVRYELGLIRKAADW